ncbi:MAG: universal stress protein, partial [Bacteroidia bacterium]
IVALADETKSTFIVMGTHGKDTDNGFFLGSNAYRVLSKSQIPVMTVKIAAEKLGFRNILLPLDSSHHSRQKVDSAIYMAEIFGATLHVIGILHEGSQAEENYKLKMETIMGQIKVLAEKQNVKCVTEIEFIDNRAKATLTYAETVNADLIIAMTDQEAEFSSIVLGNYIHQLTNDSQIPVLSIPPEVNPQLISDAIGGLEY